MMMSHISQPVEKKSVVAVTVVNNGPSLSRVPTASKIPCKHYFRNGHCSYGASCKFSHDSSL